MFIWSIEYLIFIVFSISTSEDQQNARNGVSSGTMNATAAANSSNNISTNAIGGGVVLGQIGESILYYQNDQNQQFQLWFAESTFFHSFSFDIFVIRFRFLKCLSR